MPDLGQAIVDAARRCHNWGYGRIGLVEYTECAERAGRDDRPGVRLTRRHAIAASEGAFHDALIAAGDRRAFLAWEEAKMPDAIIALTATPSRWLHERARSDRQIPGFAVMRIGTADTSHPFSGHRNDHGITATVALKLLDA